MPTATGLPISLNALGTAAVNLQMSGSLKAANFLKTHELDVEGKIRPRYVPLVLVSSIVRIFSYFHVSLYWSICFICYDVLILCSVYFSVAIDIVGTMGVDAYYASTGIKLRTNMYSSSAVEGQLKVRGTKLVSLNFNLPKDKIEIINAR